MAPVSLFCKMLLEKAEGKYGTVGLAENRISRREIDQAMLEDIFKLAVTSGGWITVKDTLDFDMDYNPEYDDDDLQEDDSSLNSQNASQDWELFQDGRTTYSLDVMQRVVSFYDNCKTKKFDQTKRRFTFVTNYETISRFRTYIAQNGRKSDKLKQLEEYVQKKFSEARLALLSVSERDLQRWGNHMARELDLDFKASRNWLYLFKKKHRVVSRKITKLTTKAEMLEADSIKTTARNFVEAFNLSTMGTPTKNIWNYDQSGFNYEHSNLRTLSNKAEKDTVVMVKSMNAVTHSYTIMPLLSMNGTLAPKLLICLQETGGELGPRVQANLQIPENIFLVSSKSGKLDKGIMRLWLNQCVVEVNPDDENILLFDSWAGQKDPALYENIKNVKSTFRIPPHTTSIIQPLDVYFFRQYKIIRRRIADRVMLEDLSIDFKQRQNILNMHALIYNQFQGSVFRPMLQYCWFACGYTENRSGHFMNVNEILFPSTSDICDELECEEDSFIRCSHCGINLCITDFLVKFHFHKQ